MSKVPNLTEFCGLRVSVETFVAPKGSFQCKHCQRFGHTQRNCGHAPRCVAYGGSHISGECPARSVQPLCCICGGNHTANYRGCVILKKAKAALAMQAPALGRGQLSQVTLRLRKLSGLGPLPSRRNWERDEAMLSVVGVLSRPALTLQYQTHPNQSVRHPSCPK